MLEGVAQSHDARYVLSLRSEPPFAETTYTARDMEAHPEALPQPLMPSRRTEANPYSHRRGAAGGEVRVPGGDG